MRLCVFQVRVTDEDLSSGEKAPFFMESTPNKACTQLVAVNVRLTLTCVPATNLRTCPGFCGSGSRNMRSNLNNIFQMSWVTPFTVSVVAQAKSHKGEICFVFYYKVGKSAVQES